MNHSFNGIGKLHIHSVFRHAGNHAFINPAGPLLHILHFLHFNGLALSLVCPAFQITGLFRHRRQNFVIVLPALFVHTPPQNFLDNPMDLQIRVSADGGGKMTVILCRQAEMSHTLHRIPGLLHRPQGQPGYQRLHRRIINLFQKLLQLLGMNLISAHMDMIAEVVDKSTQLSDFFRIRRLVGPVQEGRFLPEKVLGYGLIGRQHKIFNNLCGGIPVIGPDIQRMSLPVQHHLRLRKIKINGSPLPPLRPEKIRQFFHEEKHLRILPVLFRGLRILQGDDFIYIRITHAAVHPDHRLRNLMSDNISPAVHRHNTAQRQTVLPLIQGTDPVGQGMGQHRNHPVCQIHAGSPFQRLHIQGAVLLDIVGDVRNMDAQAVSSIRLLCHRYRVIQIFSVLPVDGHHGPVTQIQPPGPIRLRHRL